MEEIFNFLNAILINNNRPWFQQHKDLYQKAQAQMNIIAEKLILGISKFDNSVQGITVSDCTYRIYRDTRFSTDKTPYKTHLGAFICPRGKKSGLAGYYFHLEPEGAEYIGANGLYVGMYCPTPQILKSVREDLIINGKEFEDAIKKAKNFTLDTEHSLSRVPKDFPKDSPYAEYLKMRAYNLDQKISDKMLYDSHLIEWAIDEFKTTYNFNQFLNRSALFAMENGNC